MRVRGVSRWPFVEPLLLEATPTSEPCNENANKKGRDTSETEDSYNNDSAKIGSITWLF